MYLIFQIHLRRFKDTNLSAFDPGEQITKEGESVLWVGVSLLQMAESDVSKSNMLVILQIRKKNYLYANFLMLDY